jgi:hypothetical protein
MTKIAEKIWTNIEPMYNREAFVIKIGVENTRAIKVNVILFQCLDMYRVGEVSQLW